MKVNRICFFVLAFVLTFSIAYWYNNKFNRDHEAVYLDLTLKPCIDPGVKYTKLFTHAADLCVDPAGDKK